MKRFFKTIKKKKHKRRIGVLWLFLIVLELLCPVLCDKPTFAALKQQDSPTSIVRNLSGDDGDSAKKSTSITDSQTQDERQTVCNDECLCHATAIAGLPFTIQKIPFIRSEQIAFHSSEIVLSSLPPPDRPPKIS